MFLDKLKSLIAKKKNASDSTKSDGADVEYDLEFDESKLSQTFTEHVPVQLDQSHPTLLDRIKGIPFLSPLFRSTGKTQTMSTSHSGVFGKQADNDLTKTSESVKKFKLTKVYAFALFLFAIFMLFDPESETETKKVDDNKSNVKKNISKKTKKKIQKTKKKLGEKDNLKNEKNKAVKDINVNQVNTQPTEVEQNNDKVVNKKNIVDHQTEIDAIDKKEEKKQDEIDKDIVDLFKENEEIKKKVVVKKNTFDVNDVLFQKENNQEETDTVSNLDTKKSEGVFKEKEITDIQEEIDINDVVDFDTNIAEQDLSEVILQKIEEKYKKEKKQTELDRIDMKQKVNYNIKGRGLVYNCVERYWSCVDGANYKVCENQKLKAEELNKKTSCEIEAIYESDRVCEKAQLHFITELKAEDLCL